MKKFKQFFEDLTSTEISNEKHHVDMSHEDTIHEMNKKLSSVLNKPFTNTGNAFNHVRKVISMYGVQIPHFELKNDESGSHKIPLNQYPTTGETHTTVKPPFSDSSVEGILHFSYKLKDGRYEVDGKVVKA